MGFVYIRSTTHVLDPFSWKISRSGLIKCHLGQYLNFSKNLALIWFFKKDITLTIHELAHPLLMPVGLSGLTQLQMNTSAMQNSSLPNLFWHL